MTGFGWKNTDYTDLLPLTNTEKPATMNGEKLDADLVRIAYVVYRMSLRPGSTGLPQVAQGKLWDEADGRPLWSWRKRCFISQEKAQNAQKGQKNDQKSAF